MSAKLGSNRAERANDAKAPHRNGEAGGSRGSGGPGRFDGPISGACRRYREMASLYTDGMLSREDTEALLNHAQECPYCRGLVEGYTAMSMDLRRLPDALPDTSFHKEAMERVRERSLRGFEGRKARLRRAIRTRQVLRGLVSATAAAAVFVVCLCGITAGVSWLTPGKTSDGAAQNGETILLSDTFYMVGGLQFAMDESLKESMMESMLESENQSEILPELKAESMDIMSASGSVMSAGGGEEYGGSVPPATETPAGVMERAAFSVNDVVFPPQYDISQDEYATDEYFVTQVYISIEASDAYEVYNVISFLNAGINHSGVSYIGEKAMASVSITVPAQSRVFAVEALSSLGNVTYMNESSYSVAYEMADAKASLASSLSEYERLLVYTNKTADLQSLIRLSDRIYSVINEIDYYQGQVNRLNKNASRSEIYVDVSSVAQTVSKGFGAMLLQSFGDSADGFITGAENIVVRAAGLMAPLLLLASAAVLVWGVFRVLRSNREVSK